MDMRSEKHGELYIAYSETTGLVLLGINNIQTAIIVPWKLISLQPESATREEGFSKECYIKEYYHLNLLSWILLSSFPFSVVFLM